MPEGGHSTHTLEGSDPHPWGYPRLDLGVVGATVIERCILVSYARV